MSVPLIAQVIMFGGNFPPLDWAPCDGRLIAIAQNNALFALIGTTYGGDGVTTFGLPDLRGRVPVSQGTLGGGSTYVIGEMAGVENVTLITSQIPQHSHIAHNNSTVANTTDPTNNYWAAQPALKQYSASPTGAIMKANAIDLSGGSQPHSNIIPFQAINYVIALFGVFPSRN